MFMNEEREMAFSVLEKANLNFDDITEFRRYIFETGIASREEAEILMALDRRMTSDVPGWRAFFIEAITDFVVWQSRPTGRISVTDLDWLLGCLTDKPSINAVALLFEILRESHEAPQHLSETVMRLAGRA